MEPYEALYGRKLSHKLFWDSTYHISYDDKYATDSN